METKKIQDYSDTAVTNLDPEKATIVNERGVELKRLRKQVDVAIKKAEELGRSDMVKKLEARGQQLDTLLKGKTFNDIIDDGASSSATKSLDSKNSPKKDPGDKPGGDPGDKPKEDPGDEKQNNDKNDSVKDIFNRPENTKQQLGVQGKRSKKESRDPTIDEIIKDLQGINPAGKQGAVKALKDILSQRGITNFSENLAKRKLKEAIEDKALEDIDDEEFSDFVNTILDEINSITPVTYSNPDERKVKVKQAMENNLETRDIEMEQEMQKRSEKRRIRANQSELDKYVNYRPISEFSLDLYRTIADQIKQVEIYTQSYDEISPEYDDDVIMKADVVKYEQRQEKPSIDFFFDVSASWKASDVELGKRFVDSLKEFVDRGALELNVYYFSDIVDQDLELVRNYTGTSAWTKILDTVNNNNAKNVVVMTDGDMDYFAARSGQKCLVEGVVWYIWKIGGYYTTGAKELPKYLRGMQGTTQYSFNVKDVN